MTDGITKKEVFDMIQSLHASVVGFNINADKAQGVWHSILEPYSKREIWESTKHLIGSDSRITPKNIISVCNMRRKQERAREMSAEGAKQIADAKSSFEYVPDYVKKIGRHAMIPFVMAERAAYHYRCGDTENAVYNGFLARAMRMGIKFDQIDYEKIDSELNPWVALGESMELPNEIKHD